MANYTLSLAGEIVRGIESALGLGLDASEFDGAQEMVRELVSEAGMPDLAAIVASIEKATGLALDVPAYAVALAAARRTLAPYLANRVPAPDAHLEMAYEDQVSSAFAD